MSSVNKVCKVCPVNCNLTIEEDFNSLSGYKVTGNNCGRGVDFGIKAMTTPSRVLTGRVLLKNGNMGRLPVKTTGVVPEDRIEECLRIFNSTTAISPVKRGSIVIENILDLGVDVIAARRA